MHKIHHAEENTMKPLKEGTRIQLETDIDNIGKFIANVVESNHLCHHNMFDLLEYIDEAILLSIKKHLSNEVNEIFKPLIALDVIVELTGDRDVVIDVSNNPNFH